jgi:hypothetical protein
MSKRYAALLVISLMLLQTSIILTLADPDEAINVVDVTWGLPTNRLTVGPGDKAVPLTVTIQNVGSNTISGISMYLNLQPPFTNVTNGKVTSSYISSSIQPGQSASAQFLLSIGGDAKTGEYTIPLTIGYLVVEQQSTSDSTSTQQSDTYGSSKSDTDTSMKSSSTSQSQSSSTTSTQDSSTTSSSSFTVQKFVIAKKLSVWLPGKTVIEVASSIRVLTAGQLNAFPIIVRNAGSAGANSLTVSVSVQASSLGSATGVSSSSSPLVIQGSDSTWDFQDLPAGSNLTLTPEIFITTEALDKAYQIQVTVGYRDAAGTSHSETYSLGLSVQGAIDIVVQSALVAPVPVEAGGAVTVSGNLLNEGNVAAMYMNATAVVAPPFEAVDGSGLYIGELDTNTPLPFSVSLNVANGTANGTYPLKVVFYYKDSFSNTHSLERTYEVVVLTLPLSPIQNQPVMLPLRELLLILVIAAIVCCALYLLWRRRRRKGKDAG